MPGDPKHTSGLLEMQCFAANLRRAERAVHRLYAEEVRKSGLEPTQMTLLSVLAKAGEASQGDLAEWLAIDSTTLSRTLAPMINRGWIASEPGADRRVRLHRLTPAGTRLLRKARRHWQRAQNRLRRVIGADDWPQLIDQFIHVTRAAERALDRT